MNNIDKSFRNAFENFDDPVTTEHWKKISSAIHARPKKRWFVFWFPGFLLLLLTFTATLGLSLFTLRAMEETNKNHAIKGFNTNPTAKKSIRLSSLKAALSNDHYTSIRANITPSKSFKVFLNNTKKPFFQNRKTHYQNSFESPSEQNTKDHLYFIPLLLRSMNTFPYEANTNIHRIKKTLNLFVTPPEPNDPDKETHPPNPIQRPVMIFITTGVNRMNTKVDFTADLGKYHKDFRENISNQNPTSKGFMAGVKVQLNLYNRLSFQTGVEHTLLEQNIKYSYTYKDIPFTDSASGYIYGYLRIPDTLQVTHNLNRTNYYRFIEFPFQFSWKLPIKSDKMILSINPGGSTYRIININGRAADTNSIYMYPKEKASFRTTGININLSASAWLKISKHLLVGVEPVYAYSLHKFYSTEAFITHTRNFSIRLNTAYSF